MKLTELLLALALPLAAQAGCGEVRSVDAEAGRLRYALSLPDGGASAVLMLLVGGGGALDLDEAGCPRRLRGNTLVRSLPAFHAEGLATALVDAPEGWRGDDGLGGERIFGRHARDLGRVVADLRQRTGAAVWVVGTSRGSLSAANAAARLDGSQAPDGVVLSSVVSVGAQSQRKPWAAHTVFDLPLEQVRAPVLLIAQAEDRCVASPPEALPRIAARLVAAVRLENVLVTGGPGRPAPGVDACEGRSPHGYLEQEAEVAAGIARFVRGQAYRADGGAAAAGRGAALTIMRTQ
ncbi:MAG: hypothetical protein EKK52_10580 [Burkholderiales bacterium]|uniref:alpha/beta hydrolase n=1 Tax=Roseateles sp. TaxID=1971397 RepID=UPI000FA4F5EE|nr:MAG: hypothetical protein EKK52_10580 [Burkholderiales bacterium]